MSMGRKRTKESKPHPGVKVSKNGKVRGARCKLTPEVANGIISALQSGLTVEVATGCVGVSVGAYYDWMERGEKESDESIFSKFYKGVKSAKALGIASHVTAIAKHIPEDWKAAAWLLERQHGEMFGKRVENTIVGSAARPIIFHIPPVVATPRPVRSPKKP